MRWVESMRLDFEDDLEPLVAAAPSAASAAEAAHRAAPPRGSLGGGGEADHHLCSVSPRRPRGGEASGHRLARGQAGGARRRARSHGDARLPGARRAMRLGASGMLAVALMLGAISPAAAASYRWIDDDGVVHLSNSQAHVETSRRPRQPGSSRRRSRAATARLDGHALGDLQVQGESGASPDGKRHDRGHAPLRSHRPDRPPRHDDPRRVRPPAQPRSPAGRRGHSHGRANVRRGAAAGSMQEALSRSLDPERTRAPPGLAARAALPAHRRSRVRAAHGGTADRADRFRQSASLETPSPTRLMLIHRLERATDATEGSAVVLAAAGAALRKALRPFVSPAVMAQPDKGDRRPIRRWMRTRDSAPWCRSSSPTEI